MHNGNMNNVEEKKALSKKLLSDLMVELRPFLSLFGVFSGKEDEMELAREFANKFFSSLISLENHLLAKDAISASLLQRYSHEMFLDFFYVFGSSSIKEKVEEFFSYEKRLKTQPNLQTWRNKDTLKKEELRKFIPPWVAGEESMKTIYKRLSDMAHPNIVSMRLNRRGAEFEYIIIINAISLVVLNITECFLYKPFWELVYDDKKFDIINFGHKMRKFQTIAWKLLLD